MIRMYRERFFFVAVLFIAVLASKEFVLSDQAAFEAENPFTVAAVSARPPARVFAGWEKPQFEIIPLPPPAPQPSRIVAAQMELTRDARAESPRGLAPQVIAASYLVRALGVSDPFLSLHSDARWPAASLTKLMTAVIAAERIGLEKEVGVSAEAVGVEGEGGSFFAGERFIVRDLVKAMLAVSSNDAAEALAAFAGRDAFIAAMQEKAAALAMYDTVFRDPTGLSVLNQTTVNDLDRLIGYILLRHPDIMELSREPTQLITELGSGASRTLQSIHPFAASGAFLGGKTGYTPEARENLVTLFRIAGKKILIIVLGATDRMGATQTLYDFVAGR